MSSLSLVPDAVSAASGNLANLGTALRSANAAAASQTTAIAAPAADEISAATTAFFSTHAQAFQAACTRAAAFHEQFVTLLNGGAAQYLSTELTNAQGTVGAAATPAITSISNTANFGPLQFSVSQTSTGAVNLTGILNTRWGPAAWVSLNGKPFLPGNMNSIGLDVTGTGGISTRFGPLTLFTVNGTEGIYDSGQFLLSLTQSTPLYSVSESMTGFITGGTGVDVTGGSFYFDGLGFSV